MTAAMHQRQAEKAARTQGPGGLSASSARLKRAASAAFPCRRRNTLAFSTLQKAAFYTLKDGLL